VLKSALSYMSAKERSKYFALVTLRAFAAILDLLGVIALGFVASVLTSAVTGGASRINLPGIGGLVRSTGQGQLTIVLVGILVLFVLKAAISIVLTGAIATVVASVEARASVDVARNVLGGSLEDARAHSREELFFASFAGTTAAFTAQLNALATLISEGFLFICLTLTFLVVDAASTILVAAYFCFIAFFIQMAVGRRLHLAATSVRELHLQQDQTLNDLFNSFRELSVSNRREDFFSRIAALRGRTARGVSTQLRLGALPRHLIETAVILGVVVLAAIKMTRGDIQSSSLMLGVFLAGSLRMMAAMLPWQAALISLRQSAPAASKAFDLLRPDGCAEQTAHRFNEQVPQSDVALKFVQVIFKYKDSSNIVLDKVDFEVPNGSQTAIIGKSGSGKSTIADLACGLLEPIEGNVILGSQGGHKNRVAYVPQRPSAISGSVQDNITLSQTAVEIDQLRLKQAIRDANLDGFVDSLPEGLNTDMGKHMDSLSVGQLQRLGIARALYQQPEILVLDEATSSLDAESEHAVSETLERLKGRVTVIVIAHKLVTVQRSDQVLLIENGKIKDRGKFDKIVRGNPEIARAIELSSFS
jgi:ATP-binding cassette, subfamily B, bacterial PglK